MHKMQCHYRYIHSVDMDNCMYQLCRGDENRILSKNHGLVMCQELGFYKHKMQRHYKYIHFAHMDNCTSQLYKDTKKHIAIKVKKGALR